MKYPSWIKIAIIVGAIIIGSIALFISKTPDSPIEQAAEAILKTQGVDVDLSPEIGE